MCACGLCSDRVLMFSHLKVSDIYLTLLLFFFFYENKHMQKDYSTSNTLLND